MQRDIVVYDVEINRLLKGRDWKYIDRSLFASAVAYSFGQDKFYSFLHIDALDDLISLLHGNVVVTFNGINFDSKVSLGSNRKLKEYGNTGIYVVGDGARWLEYDVFVQCLKHVRGVRSDMGACNKRSPGGLKLDDIARCTLRRGKSASGSVAPMYYQSGQYDKLLEYNLRDVEITRDVFIHAVKHGTLVGRDSRIKIRRDKFFYENLAKILDMDTEESIQETGI